MVEGPPKNVGTFPKKIPKSTTHVVRPVSYFSGRVSVFLGLLSAFAAFMGFLGALSRIFGLGLWIPGALAVSVMGGFFALLALAFAIRQRQIAQNWTATAGAILGTLALIGAGLAVAGILIAPAASVDNSGFGPDIGPGPVGNGYCSATSDCADFGDRHCNGDVVCASDNLCHCQFVTCRGSNCGPLKCSSGCDANSKCDAASGTCIFKQGGKTGD